METVNTQGLLGNSTLSTQIERVPATDPFHTAKRGETQRISVMMAIGIRDPRLQKVRMLKRVNSGLRSLLSAGAIFSFPILPLLPHLHQAACA